MGDERRTLLEEALEAPFQEIPDSPTVRYYTNWNSFKRKLGLPGSQRYASLPSWAEKLPGQRIILAETLSTDYPEAEPITQPRKILEDLGVKGKMELYHAARFNAAAEIRVPEGGKAELLIASLGGDAYTGHHLTVRVGRGARLKAIVLDLAEAGLKTFTIALHAGEGSIVELSGVSLHGGEATVYSRRVLHLASRARSVSRILAVPGEASRIQEDYHLDGESAEVESYTSGLSRPGAWGDVVVNARHSAPNTGSRVGGRGVVHDHGTLALRGLAMVLPEATGSSTRVEVYMASLGDEARAYAVPMLEIHTGEVREAYHSASVASLSRDLLFYMRTRGFTPEEAKTLLVEGALRYSGVLDEIGLTVEEVAGR